MNLQWAERQEAPVDLFGLLSYSFAKGLEQCAFSLDSLSLRPQVCVYQNTTQHQQLLNAQKTSYLEEIATSSLSQPYKSKLSSLHSTTSCSILSLGGGLRQPQLLADGLPGLPVVAVDVIQPAALLDDLHGAGDVLPGGEAVEPLVLLTVAWLYTAAVGPLLLPAGVEVDALLGLRAPQDGTCTAGRGERVRGLGSEDHQSKRFYG